MARIFLCHASEDKAQAREVYQKLEALGFAPWLDEVDILPGQDWDYEIEQALETSDFVMVFLSTRSVEKVGYVQREFRRALYHAEERPEGFIHTIPVKLDDCTVPRRFSRHQWANLYENGAFDRIVRALHHGLQQRGQPLPEPLTHDPTPARPGTASPPTASALEPIATYTLADYIQDLRTVTSETQDPNEIIARLGPLAERAALSREWLKPHHYECDPEQGFGVHLLHEEADHTLAVFAAAWLPGRGAPPHNHGTWAVVSVVDGLETNVFWKRVDDGTRPGYAEIRRNGEKLFGAGEVVAFLPHAIHSVMNETQAVTVSLHTYGKHLNYTGRSQFDPDARAEKPFLVKEQ